MPGCCVPNCKNSSAKGFLMKHFPRNKRIRAQWVLNIPRFKWIPTDYSCICEMHFPLEMWEKPRVDGKRILKHNAVPIIFEKKESTASVTISEEPTVKPRVDGKRILKHNAVPIIFEGMISSMDYTYDI